MFVLDVCIGFYESLFLGTVLLVLIPNNFKPGPQLSNRAENFQTGRWEAKSNSNRAHRPVKMGWLEPWNYTLGSEQHKSWNARAGSAHNWLV